MLLSFKPFFLLVPTPLSSNPPPPRRKIYDDDDRYPASQASYKPTDPYSKQQDPYYQPQYDPRYDDDDRYNDNFNDRRYDDDRYSDANNNNRSHSGNNRAPAAARQPEYDEGGFVIDNPAAARFSQI